MVLARADWENTLERSLRTTGAMKLHIPHMYAIGRLADQYVRHMGPVVVRVHARPSISLQRLSLGYLLHFSSPTPFFMSPILITVVSLSAAVSSGYASLCLPLSCLQSQLDPAAWLNSRVGHYFADCEVWHSCTVARICTILGFRVFVIADDEPRTV